MPPRSRCRLSGLGLEASLESSCTACSTLHEILLGNLEFGFWSFSGCRTLEFGAFSEKVGCWMLEFLS